MSEYLADERILIDRSVPAVFVRYTDSGGAVVRIGLDTRVVDPVILSRLEA